MIEYKGYLNIIRLKPKKKKILLQYEEYRYYKRTKMYRNIPTKLR